jgi:hypothetical protein
MRITKKSVVSMLLIVSILISFAAQTFAQTTDLKPSDNNSITRAEFVAMINKAFGFTQKAEINFSDVPSGSCIAEDFAKAKAAGYISGYGDGTARPDNPVSRLEAAKIVSTLLKCSTSCGDTCAVEQFRDAGEIPGWGKEFLNTLVVGKYYQGYSDGTIRPLQPITRAEAVALLYKVQGDTVKVSSTPSDTQTFAGEQEFEGWLVDAHCAPMLLGNPSKMSKECLQCPQCEGSGYGIIVKQQNGTNKFYKFDENGHKLAKENIINKTARENNLAIRVKGTIEGEVIKVSTIEEN